MSLPILDLHGIKHEDVTHKVQEWVLQQDYFRKINPLKATSAFMGKIITGNSTKMRTLVEGVLHKHKFDYNRISDGSIIVVGKL